MDPQERASSGRTDAPDFEQPGQVVVVERRGALELARVATAGARRLRIQSGEGPVVRLQRERLVYTFDAVVDRGVSAGEAIDAWRARFEAPPIDLQALCGSIEPETEYSLAELAERAQPGGGPAAILALVEAYSVRLPELFITRGRIQRVAPERAERIRERLRVEQQLEAENEAFRAWFQSAPPGAEAPAGFAVFLEGLKGLAMGGFDQGEKRFRSLAKELGAGNPDELLERLIARGVLPEDINELPARAGLAPAYPREAEREAWAALADLTPSSEGRRDLRQRWTITIDQPETEDVDDALSYWEEDGQAYLAIHIADVDAAVPFGGALDLAARERASSIYFRDSVRAMLPRTLVVDGLSLNPGVDRPALSCIVALDSEGRAMGEPELTASLLRVDERLSYLDTEEGAVADDPRMQILEGAAAALRRRREEDGAFHLAQFDLRFRFGEGVAVTPVPMTTRGHRIVSELMVYYNRAVARRLVEAKAPAFYRLQPTPVRRPARPLTRVIDRLRFRFPPSHLSVSPGAHRTLGVDAYVQATAPIRRYLDLVAQRQLKSVLETGAPRHDAAVIEAWRAELEPRLSRVRRLEDSRLSYWMLRCLQQDPGPHQAVVSRMRARGRLLVYLPAFHWEVPLRGVEDGVLKIGEEVSAIITDCAPRARRVRAELFDLEGLDDEAEPA